MSEIRKLVNEVENSINTNKSQNFINFKWCNNSQIIDSKINLQSNKMKIILSKNDLLGLKLQSNILCYDGKITNINEINDIYNNGFRVTRLKENINISRINVRKIENSKLIIDGYNISERNFKKLLKYANKPIFLTYKNNNIIEKNKYANFQIESTKAMGGIIGINIIKQYQKSNVERYNSFENIFRQIDSLIEIIGIDNLCISSGIDKNSVLPWEVSNIGDIKVIENWLKVFYGDEVVEKIMWKNAYTFLNASME